jgi:hypothetical protein
VDDGEHRRKAKRRRPGAIYVRVRGWMDGWMDGMGRRRRGRPAAHRPIDCPSSAVAALPQWSRGRATFLPPLSIPHLPPPPVRVRLPTRHPASPPSIPPLPPPSTLPSSILIDGWDEGKMVVGALGLLGIGLFGWGEGDTDG